MTYEAGVANFYPKYLSVLSMWSLALDIASYQISGGNNTTNWTANRAMYVPIYLPREVVVTKFFTANGGTATGNTDVGIYDAAGTRLQSTGAVAMSGTATIQEFDVTDFGIGRGAYWLGISNSSTGRYNCVAESATDTPARWGAMGVRTQETAHPLPSTLSLATHTSVSIVPIFGLVVR